MNTYTVKQLADLTGITVRTLHHYDDIGLLEPSSRSEADHRLYNHQDLLRLQQILLYKEMEFSLADIQALLDDPEYNLLKSLKDQQQFLMHQKDRYRQLIQTVEKTIAQLESDQELVTDKELYGGFTPEQRERYDAEAKEKYGEMYEISQKRVRQMTKGEWKALGAESEAFTKALATMLDQDPKSPEVQEQVKRHFNWVSHFYPCSKERYLGLASLYVDNPEFTAHYDRYASGLAAFLKKGMEHYANTNL